MEFEVELETARDYVKGFITDTQGNKEEISVKTDQDSLSSLIKCIEEGARKYSCSARDLLKRAKWVKFVAPEMVMDTLDKKEGARIGLVVTKGQAQRAYFEGEGDNPAFGFIVAKEMIVAIDEGIGPEGEQILKPREEEVRDKVRYLLEFGAGIIVISLLNAPRNPENERFVKEVIDSDYPRHYLGAVPVLVASDFSDARDDFLRTNVCLLNAYTWFNVDHFLRRVEAFLQKNGYNYSLQVTQADGRADYIHRVTPLKTCVSDQIAFIKSIYG